MKQFLNNRSSSLMMSIGCEPSWRSSPINPMRFIAVYLGTTIPFIQVNYSQYWPVSMIPLLMACGLVQRQKLSQKLSLLTTNTKDSFHGEQNLQEWCCQEIP